MCMLILLSKCYLEHLETTVYWLIFQTWHLQDDIWQITSDFSKWIALPNEIVQVCTLSWSDCTLSFTSMSNKHKCSHQDLGTLRTVLIFVYLDASFALPLPFSLLWSHLWFALETNHATSSTGTVVFPVHTPSADTNSHWRTDPSSAEPTIHMSPLVLQTQFHAHSCMHAFHLSHWVMCYPAVCSGGSRFGSFSLCIAGPGPSWDFSLASALISALL